MEWGTRIGLLERGKRGTCLDVVDRDQPGACDRWSGSSCAEYCFLEKHASNRDEKLSFTGWAAAVSTSRQMNT